MTGEYTPDREQFEKIKNILEEDILTKEEYKTEKKEAFRFITSILRKGKRPTFGLLSDIKSGSNALYKSLLKLFYFNKAKIKLKIYPYFFDKNNFKVSATCNLQSPVIVDVIC
jgi:hypothetical protein